jgi:hypothetical protein
VWLAFEPRNADWGFEESLTEFANPHCAVEAEHFLPHPRPGICKKQQRGRRRSDQTNNKQTSNKVAGAD